MIKRIQEQLLLSDTELDAVAGGSGSDSGRLYGGTGNDTLLGDRGNDDIPYESLSFLAFDAGFVGGISVAAADLDG